MRDPDYKGLLPPVGPEGPEGPDGPEANGWLEFGLKLGFRFGFWLGLKVGP